MELSILPLALYDTNLQSTLLFRGVKTTQEHVKGKNGQGKYLKR